MTTRNLLQACRKILPLVGGIIVFFVLLFALYVRSVAKPVESTKPVDKPQQPVVEADPKITLDMMDKDPDYVNARIQEAVNEARQARRDEPPPPLEETTTTTSTATESDTIEL